MTRVLVTGGTGVLGQRIVTRLQAQNYTVRIMSRSAPRLEAGSPLEWAQAQLSTGAGLAEAVAEVDIIVHAASSPFKNAQQVDVDGTRVLLEHARQAGVGHFIYISIVGVDQNLLAYHQVKYATEQIVANGDVPWTILRTTQFHDLLDKVFAGLSKLPLIMPYVPGISFQTIDEDEVADQLVHAVANPPAGRLPDMGGPEVLTMKEMIQRWLAAQGKQRILVPLPLFGEAMRRVRNGVHLTPDHAVGVSTWADWLAARYAVSPRRAHDAEIEGVVSAKAK